MGLAPLPAPSRPPVRDDVAVVTANPKTAGVARWIFLALWGVKLGKGKKAATQYTTKVGAGLCKAWGRAW